MDVKNILPIISLILVIGVTASIGVFVTSEVGTQLKDETTFADDKITLSNGTAVSLTHDEIQSISTVYNATNESQTLADGKYTTDKTAGTVTLTDNTYDSTDWNFTYKYLADTNSSVAADNTTSAVGDIPTWLGIIVVVVMAVIILGLIGKAFTKSR